jgi:transposase-like protein
VLQNRVTREAGLTRADPAGDPLIFQGWCEMDRCVGAATRLPESDRKNLAVQALAPSATISDLSSRHGVSRKFVYQQARKARLALDDGSISAAGDDEVLFEIPVTKRWLRQVIVALALMCRGSYLGIIEFMREPAGHPSA